MYNKKTFFFIILSVICVFAATSVYARGHEKCKLCHKIVNKKAAGIKVKPDTKSISAFTGKKFGPQNAICVACHPVFKHRRGHVYGIKPKRVKVPKELIGKGTQEGEMVCTSCHDIHDNASYKYLRNHVSDLSEVLHVCVLCHPKNANQETLNAVRDKLERYGSKIKLPMKKYRK